MVGCVCVLGGGGGGGMAYIGEDLKAIVCL